MKFYNVPTGLLREIADEVGVVLFNPRPTGRAITATLRPCPALPGQPRQWGRLSANACTGSRRVHAVCWHGHYEFLWRLFAIVPEAKVVTAWATYAGPSGFADKAPETAWRNVGNRMSPRHACEVCDCGQAGVAPTPGAVRRRFAMAGVVA